MKVKSYLLGFSQISDEEAAMMINKQMNGFIDDEHGAVTPVSMEHALDNTVLLDKLLAVSKSYSLMTKKRGLKHHLSAVIGNHIGHNEKHLNQKA